MPLLVKILGDLAVVNLGFLAAFVVRFGLEICPANWQAYWYMAPWIALVAFILFYSYGLYLPERRYWDEIFAALICVVGILSVTAAALTFFFHRFAFPRTVFILSVPLHLLFLGVWRRFIWAWSLKRSGALKLLVIGSETEAIRRAQMLVHENPDMYHVSGLVVEKLRKCKQCNDHGELNNAGDLSNKQSGFSVLGSYDDIEQILNNIGGSISADGVLFCDGIPREIRARLMHRVIARDLAVFAVPDIHDILIAQSQMVHLDGIPVFRVSGFARHPVRSWKRVTDIILALIFGVATLPLLCLAAVAIKAGSSAGPVFYRQERIGQGGRRFKLLKLRTMVLDAENSTGPVLATSGDPRITKVGHWLRAFRIDELPQLWNVLKGEMSIIGPRPERPVFVEQFSEKIPGYDYRHRLKTGITGLAQVEGKYSTSPDDKLRFDLLYAKGVSPLKDAQILLHTLKVMLMRSKNL